jgi:pilus assembly protein Flp/PilA
MNNFTVRLKNLRSDESGQDMIEYALIAALVSLVSVTALTTLGTDITAIWTKLGTTLTTAT